jgi:hypothetical protein
MKLLASRGPGIAVSIVTGYGPELGDGVRVPVGSRMFSMLYRPPLGSIQPPIQWVPGDIFPGR